MATNNSIPHEPNFGKGFQVLVAGADMKFRSLAFDEKLVTAKEILIKENFQPPIEYALVELLSDGTKIIDPKDAIDTTRNTPTQLLVGKTDSFYRLAIDGNMYELPFSEIGVTQLYALARLGGFKKVLSLKRLNQDEEYLFPNDSVAFSISGVEQLTSHAGLTVYYNNEHEFVLPNGEFHYNRMSVLFGLQPNYVLTYINSEGSLTQFEDTATVELFEGIRFFSQPNHGSSS